MTMPNSASYTIPPVYDAGDRIVSPCARNELFPFKKYSGSGGSTWLTDAISARKLATSATILVGTLGVKTVTSASASV